MSPDGSPVEDWANLLSSGTTQTAALMTGAAALGLKQGEAASLWLLYEMGSRLSSCSGYTLQPFSTSPATQEGIETEKPSSAPLHSWECLHIHRRNGCVTAHPVACDTCIPRHVRLQSESCRLGLTRVRQTSSALKQAMTATLCNEYSPLSLMSGDVSPL